jgi:hypothetical protein
MHHLEKIWDIFDHNSQKVNEKSMAMIALDNQLFTVVEHEGFINFMAHMQPQYCLPSRRYFSKTMLPMLFVEARKKSAALIRRQNESLSFTSDILTADTSNESFVSHHHTVTGLMKALLIAVWYLMHTTFPNHTRYKVRCF